MMNCFFAKNHLSAYIDGTLAPYHVEELEAHLETCVSCKRVRDELMAVRKTLGTIPEVEVNNRLRVNVRISLNKRRSLFPWHTHFMLPPRTILPLMLVSLSGTLIGWVYRAPPQPLEKTSIQEEIIGKVEPEVKAPPAVKEEAPVVVKESVAPEKPISPAEIRLYGPFSETAIGKKNPREIAKMKQAMMDEIKRDAGNRANGSVPDMKNLSTSKPQSTDPALLARAKPAAPQTPAATEEKPQPSAEPVNEFAGYEISVAATLDATSLKEGEEGIRTECKRLRCRDLKGGRNLVFNPDEGGQTLSLRLPAKYYPILRAHMQKWGALSDSVTSVIAKARPESDNAEGEGETPKVGIADLPRGGMAPITLKISLQGGESPETPPAE